MHPGRVVAETLRSAGPVVSAGGTSGAASQPPSQEREKPLTDPSDLVTLLGRFASSAALSVITIVLFAKGIYVVGIGVGIVSLLFQRSAVKLWRRLRDERMAAEAARAAAFVPSAEVVS